MIGTSSCLPNRKRKSSTRFIVILVRVRRLAPREGRILRDCGRACLADSGLYSPAASGLTSIKGKAAPAKLYCTLFSPPFAAIFMFSMKHPLWLVGFRPFFSLACIAGALLPIVWALIFTGALPAPTTPFSPSQWHAHEMFFGFGWAVLGAFCSPPPELGHIRGYHGAALMVLVAAWLMERLGMGSPVTCRGRYFC